MTNSMQNTSDLAHDHNDHAVLGKSRVDVLIVGAGPTGLMLANQLVRRGVRILIVDRHSGAAQQTRAMAVHARTLEIYAQLGIADLAVELGRRGAGANMWAQGRRSARIPFGDIGKDLSPFPFVLMLGQDENERILGEHLRKAGVSVQWNTELVALQQSPGRVTAELRTRDGRTHAVTSAYVAGCDGGRSTVRELNGIQFPGAAYEHVFFVADTEAVGPMVPEELNVYLWRDGFHLFFPMRGADRWRVIGIVPREFLGSEHLTFEPLIPAIRREAGADLTFRSCAWFSTYRIHHRCTERFRDRRCFLLGDAAHVHSPMGGQGMNTGLQDAYNLAWKLAFVIRGQAADQLLDSYEIERLQVAKTLLGSTDRAFTLIVSDRWIAGVLRTRVVAKIAAFAMNFQRVKTLAFRTLSQIGIRYPGSSLSRNLPGLPSDAPRAGDRFPWLKLKFNDAAPIEDLFDKLDDTCFSLLLFGQTWNSEQSPYPGELLLVYTVSSKGSNAAELARAHIPDTSFYLLRPDGHIALAGCELQYSAISDWFAVARIDTRGGSPGTSGTSAEIARHG